MEWGRFRRGGSVHLRNERGDSGVRKLDKVQGGWRREEGWGRGEGRDDAQGFMAR